MQMKEFTLKEFEDIFQAIEVVKQKIVDADLNLHQSMQIRRDMDKALCVYQHMYEDIKKEKTVQSTLRKYSEDNKDVFVSERLTLGMIFRISLFLFCPV
jgi:hypothetical protein